MPVIRVTPSQEAKKIFCRERVERLRSCDQNTSGDFCDEGTKSEEWCTRYVRGKDGVERSFDFARRRKIEGKGKKEKSKVRLSPLDGFVFFI